MSFFNLKSGSSPKSNSNPFLKQKEVESTLSVRRSYIESRRETSENQDEAESWLMTYGDMMTLLLTFFVLLYTISDVNTSKFEQIKSAISGEVLKKEPEKPFEEITKELQSLIKVQQLEQAVSVETDPLGVKIELASSSLYVLGSAEIKKSMIEIIKDVGISIQKLDVKDFLIEVEGHTDDIPIKSVKHESNWELSAHRATNVVKELIQSGLPANHLKASGFADSRPLVPNKNQNGVSIPANQEKNRRVLIYVRRNTSYKN